MTPCMTELWWTPATAAIQSEWLEPSIFLNLPVCTFLFWILPFIFIQHFGLLFSILPVQLLGGSYRAAIKLQIKSGYWITAFIIHQTLQFRGSFGGPAWKMWQNPNTNKMFPRGVGWIWRYITHNTAHNLFKWLRLLIRVREQLHQPLLKVKTTLVPRLGVHCAVQVHTDHRMRPTACHWVNLTSRIM